MAGFFLMASCNMGQSFSGNKKPRQADAWRGGELG
jgi:hypothetical protein